jgi:hypothetical protein
LSKIHHILGHKESLQKYKEKIVISSILSDHKEMKPVVNNRRNHANTGIE